MAIDLEAGADLRGIRKALERIADVLEGVAAPPVPVADEAPAGCSHPVEFRKDFGMTNGLEDWECGVKGCGYRSTSEVR